MTDYKILAQSAPDAGVDQSIYQVPPGKSVIIRSINITNTSQGSDEYDIAYTDEGFVNTASEHTFVAVAYGSTIAATSPDGITWTQRTLPVSASWRSVTYGNNTFVAVASSSSIAATSPDGITWTQRTLPVSAQWRSVIYGNNTFVAVAYYSTIAATSPDGITWTQRTLPVSAQWRSVTYAKLNTRKLSST